MDNNRRTCLRESVPGLVGTQLVSHSSASHIAYNPGTGEFKIGEEYGYM